ncbi:MAG: flagellar hook assembly protein FlgD [Bdellovibrionota bacterium]
MSDIKSVNNNVSKPKDQHVEQMRQKIGTEFSDRKIAGKHNKNEMGKDDFVKLMSAQLKYQDPMSPLKNEEMAAQLAQFSALEQMMNVNQNLEKMTAGQKPQENVIAASLIGKRIQTDSSRFQFAKGTQPEIKFELPGDAETVNVSVVDAKGEIVRELELGVMTKGQQSLRWDGKNGKGQEQPLGEYTFRVAATGDGGKPIQINTSTAGLVSGVSFEGGKAMLMVGDKKIALETVGKIEADSPGAAQPQGAARALTNADVLSAGAKVPDGTEGAKLSAPSSTNKQKTTQQVKNNLPGDLSIEKIKSMLKGLGASSAKESAENESAPEGENGGTEVDPLWNPNATL